MTTSQRTTSCPRSILERAQLCRIPAPHCEPVARPELDDRFGPAAHGARVVVLAAPAGSGKTVLLHDWLARRTAHTPDTAVAWLTVTPALDRDSSHWVELAAALRAALGTPPPPPETVTPVHYATHLAGVLAAQAIPAVLVIDDAHLLTNSYLLAAIEYLIRHAPPTVTVVLAGRHEPPLRWHGLHVHDRLTRIDAKDLELSGSQVAQLFRQHRCEPGEAVLERVREISGGWAVVVRIAAIMLAAAPDPGTALAELARPAQPVVDYLLGEVLAGLPWDTREFLMRTSISARFTEDLAMALHGGRTREILGELLQLGIPVTRRSAAGEVWYAYHPLLRAYFAAELEQRNAEEAGRLRQLEREYRREFLRARGAGLVLDGRGPELFDTVAEPGSAFAEDPYLWRLRSTDALTRGASGRAATYSDFQGGQPQSPSEIAPPAWLAALDFAIAADIAVTTGTGVTDLDPLDAYAATGNSDIDCYVYVQYGTAMLLQGRFDRAAALLKSGITIAEHFARPRLMLLAMTRLAVTVGYQGSITAMRGLADEAVEFARRQGITDSPDTQRALIAAAMGRVIQGEDWDRRIVGDLADAAGLPTPHGMPADALPTEIDWRLLAVIAVGGRETLHALRTGLLDLLRRGPQPPTGAGLLLDATVARLARSREIAAAAETVAVARQALGETAEVTVAQAMLSAAAHQTRSTRAVLEPLLWYGDSAHPMTLVTGWLLYAEAQHRLGAFTKTVEALRAALALSAPERVIRPWLNNPMSIELLDIHSGRFGAGEDFAEVIRHHPAAVRDFPAPGLTESELLVLQQLPSGRTGAEIAADLGVSINTVKTHLRSVYLKLGANSRGQAITRGRAAGLL
ncbi:LuxR C-terminal-related transcriptional regulator [Nocardia yamanashiensis]|uniref:LuxR C-terminal-related transcriptional regulator n=1 Tax=Nocardia yamanashiensis TaxID=209247 RepID=UPI000A0438C6|nr:LuxR C-terminal-related transcriptional regulator [Nocardia yamanashiensis]